MRKLWIGIGILILLSPLGLIVPAKFGAGTAWGEWSAGEIQKLTGHLPAGFHKAEPWSAPVPDYALKGQQNAGIHTLSISYILSGIVGVAAVVILVLLLGRWMTKKEGPDAA